MLNATCSARVLRSQGLWNIHRKLYSWLKICCFFSPLKKFLSFLNPKQNSLNRSSLASNTACGVTFPRTEDIISKHIMLCHLLRFFPIDRHQLRQIVLLIPPGRHQSALDAAVPGAAEALTFTRSAPWAGTAALARQL